MGTGGQGLGASRAGFSARWSRGRKSVPSAGSAHPKVEVARAVASMAVGKSAQHCVWMLDRRAEG